MRKSQWSKKKTKKKSTRFNNRLNRDLTMMFRRNLGGLICTKIGKLTTRRRKLITQTSTGTRIRVCIYQMTRILSNKLSHRRQMGWALTKRLRFFSWISAWKRTRRAKTLEARLRRQFNKICNRTAIIRRTQRFLLMQKSKRLSVTILTWTKMRWNANGSWRKTLRL